MNGVSGGSILSRTLNGLTPGGQTSAQDLDFNLNLNLTLANLFSSDDVPEGSSNLYNRDRAFIPPMGDASVLQDASLNLVSTTGLDISGNNTTKTLDFSLNSATLSSLALADTALQTLSVAGLVNVHNTLEAGSNITIEEKAGATNVLKISNTYSYTLPSNVMVEGEGVSLLTNDASFISGLLKDGDAVTKHTALKGSQNIALATEAGDVLRIDASGLQTALTVTTDNFSSALTVPNLSFSSLDHQHCDVSGSIVGNTYEVSLDLHLHDLIRSYTTDTPYEGQYLDVDGHHVHIVHDGNRNVTRRHLITKAKDGTVDLLHKNVWYEDIRYPPFPGINFIMALEDVNNNSKGVQSIFTGRPCIIDSSTIVHNLSIPDTNGRLYLAGTTSVRFWDNARKFSLNCPGDVNSYFHTHTNIPWPDAIALGFGDNVLISFGFALKSVAQTGYLWAQNHSVGGFDYKQYLKLNSNNKITYGFVNSSNQIQEEEINVTFEDIDTHWDVVFHRWNGTNAGFSFWLDGTLIVRSTLGATTGTAPSARYMIWGPSLSCYITAPHVWYVGSEENERVGIPNNIIHTGSYNDWYARAALGQYDSSGASILKCVWVGTGTSTYLENVLNKEYITTDISSNSIQPSHLAQTTIDTLTTYPQAFGADITSVVAGTDVDISLNTGVLTIAADLTVPTPTGTDEIRTRLNSHLANKWDIQSQTGNSATDLDFTTGKLALKGTADIDFTYERDSQFDLTITNSNGQTSSDLFYGLDWSTIYFNGEAGQAMETGSITNILGGSFDYSAWRISFFINPVSTASDQTILYINRPVPVTLALYLQIKTGGTLYLSYKSGNAQNLSITSVSTLPTNTWSHVSIDFKNVTSTASLLINGAVDASGAFATNNWASDGFPPNKLAVGKLLSTESLFIGSLTCLAILDNPTAVHIPDTSTTPYNVYDFYRDARLFYSGKVANGKVLMNNSLALIQPILSGGGGGGGGSYPTYGGSDVTSFVQGTNVTLTNNAGALTIDASGGGGSSATFNGVSYSNVLNTSPISFTPAGSDITIGVSTGGITTSFIADDAVTVDKLGVGAVDETALATNAVTSTKIADGAVTSLKYATNSIASGILQSSSVSSANIISSAVTEDKIATGAVTETKIGSLAVTGPKLAFNSVANANIIDSAVTAAKIQSGNIVSSHLNTSLSQQLLENTQVVILAPTMLAQAQLTVYYPPPQLYRTVGGALFTPPADTWNSQNFQGFGVSRWFLYNRLAFTDGYSLNPTVRLNWNEIYLRGGTWVLNPLVFKTADGLWRRRFQQIYYSKNIDEYGPFGNQLYLVNVAFQANNRYVYEEDTNILPAAIELSINSCFQIDFGPEVQSEPTPSVPPGGSGVLIETGDLYPLLLGTYVYGTLAGNPLIDQALGAPGGVVPAPSTDDVLSGQNFNAAGESVLLAPTETMLILSDYGNLRVQQPNVYYFNETFKTHIGSLYTYFYTQRRLLRGDKMFPVELLADGTMSAIAFSAGDREALCTYIYNYQPPLWDGTDTNYETYLNDTTPASRAQEFRYWNGASHVLTTTSGGVYPYMSYKRFSYLELNPRSFLVREDVYTTAIGWGTQTATDFDASSIKATYGTDASSNLFKLFQATYKWIKYGTVRAADTYADGGSLYTWWSTYLVPHWDTLAAADELFVYGFTTLANKATQEPNKFRFHHNIFRGVGIATWTLVPATVSQANYDTLQTNIFS